MTKLSKTLPLENIKEAWEADCLDVKKVADYLTPVIGSIRQPFVISLNAPYGTGKTFFIRNWQKELVDHHGYKAVYFNAWETDYTDNALVAFISSLEDQLRDGVSEAASLITAGAGYIAQKSLIALAKGVARKCVGDETVKELVDLVSLSEEDIAGFASTLAEDAFKKHKEVTKSVEEFKKQLGELVQQISDGTEDEDKKKLIIFVDELDRCRPTYAVEVLECIKHLFNVPGVVFVLAVDIDQLKATIAKTYGAPDDGEGYLRKFIDWQLNLPKLSRRQFCEVLYGEFKLEETSKFTKDQTTHTDYRLMLDAVAWVSDAYDLSLRTISQIFTDINLSVRNLDENQLPFAFPLGCVAALRHAGIQSSKIRNACFGLADRDAIIEKMVSYLKSAPVPPSLRQHMLAETLLRCIFINRNEGRSLRDKENELSQVMQKAREAKAEISTKMMNEYKYIEGMCNAYDALTFTNRMLSFEEPPAQRVFERLEKASFLTERS